MDNDIRRTEVVLGKLPEYLCLTVIIKELKISVEQGIILSSKPRLTFSKEHQTSFKSKCITKFEFELGYF